MHLERRRPVAKSAFEANPWLLASAEREAGQCNAEISHSGFLSANQTDWVALNQSGIMAFHLVVEVVGVDGAVQENYRRTLSVDTLQMAV